MRNPLARVSFCPSRKCIRVLASRADGFNTLDWGWNQRVRALNFNTRAIWIGEFDEISRSLCNNYHDRMLEYISSSLQPSSYSVLLKLAANALRIDPQSVSLPTSLRYESMRSHVIPLTATDGTAWSNLTPWKHAFIVFDKAFRVNTTLLSSARRRLKRDISQTSPGGRLN
ncbi:hypothetical protein RRG08_021268 [Elysia crispata]|uniref:Uncharacterized protein n=1 Tax=Elysia crispata TaxID=231223 RepID=A0AAE1D4H7_9GAST|nr:hypothetical protein RRG08_021268 [Elysia crispata]